MAENVDLKVRCPSCGSKYKIPAKAVGHKVRCVKCQTAFRISDPKGDSHRSPSPDPKASAPPRSAPVTGSKPPPTSPAGEPGPKRPPTDDDILRWLSEADNEADRERQIEMSIDPPLTADQPPAGKPPAITVPTMESRETHFSLSTEGRMTPGQGRSGDVLMMHRAAGSRLNY